MNTFLIILLRTFHVLAGALWFGAAVSYLLFFKPSVKAIGPAGPQFMHSLTERRKYPVFMISTSLLTVLAGVILYLNVQTTMVTAKGQTTDVVFELNDTGEFAYYCTVPGHRQAGMEGRFIISEP